MVKYSLVENNLTDRAEDFSAIAHSSVVLYKEDIIGRIMKTGTTVTKTDVVAVLNNLEEVVVDALEDGCSIVLPLVNMSFSISGVFDGVMDSFDSNRHKGNINATKGILVRDVEKKLKFEKVNTIIPQPQIQEVKNCVNGEVNLSVPSNGLFEVRGYNLKIDGDDPLCGLWFIDEHGNEYKADVFSDNKPGRIVVQVPHLGGSECQIRISTQSSGGSNKLLKLPRTFTYPKVLTIIY